MKRSTYTEVSNPDPSLPIKGGLYPTIRKKLLHVFRGQFCFDFGTPLFCGGTFEVEKGEEQKLSLDLKVKGFGVGIEHTYKTTQKATYTVDNCDSASPVIWYKDAELHVYESVVDIGIWRWIRQENEFFGLSRGAIHMNRVVNDPDCGCDQNRPPAPTGDDIVDAGPGPLPCCKSIATVSFSSLDPTAGEPHAELLDEVAIAAESALEDALEPSVDFLGIEPEVIESAVLGIGGEAQRLEPHAQVTMSPRLTIMSGNCETRLRGGLVIRDGHEFLPILGFAPSTNAERVRLSVFVQLPGEDELQHYGDMPVAIRVANFTTVWSAIRLEAIPDDANGFVEVELLDAEEHPVGIPTRIPFLKDHVPVNSLASVPMPA